MLTIRLMTLGEYLSFAVRWSVPAAVWRSPSSKRSSCAGSASQKHSISN